MSDAPTSSAHITCWHICICSTHLSLSHTHTHSTYTHANTRTRTHQESIRRRSTAATAIQTPHTHIWRQHAANLVNSRSCKHRVNAGRCALHTSGVNVSAQNAAVLATAAEECCNQGSAGASAQHADESEYGSHISQPAIAYQYTSTCAQSGAGVTRRGRNRGAHTTLSVVGLQVVFCWCVCVCVPAACVCVWCACVCLSVCRATCVNLYKTARLDGTMDIDTV